jgi:hypothetical protein
MRKILYRAVSRNKQIQKHLSNLYGVKYFCSGENEFHLKDGRTNLVTIHAGDNFKIEPIYELQI